jgi:poly-gamma-glutamate capsule biosynthesis protein CapA/YwtB (metallophosphatase superfamily)
MLKYSRRIDDVLMNGIMASLKEQLPWRVRRRIDRLQLAYMRFVSGQNALHVHEGSAIASLVAVGDVALTGSIGSALQSHDELEMLKDIRSIFSDCDLRIGNLETVLTDEERSSDSIGAFMKASPAALGFLSAAGFNMVTLANNQDCRLAGLLQCCRLLEEKGIQHCGVGSSLEQSRSPAIMEVAGLKVGMLGYCDNFRVDADDAENVAPAPALDDWIISDICALRPRVDLVIVQLHWGWEFSLYPLLSYRDRARRFAEAGADLVLCHHAHVPMGVEVWKGSIVGHGLGNFIFPRDSYLVDGHPWAYRSYALKVFFNKPSVLRAELIPYVIDDMGFPKIAMGNVAREILGGVGRASTRLGDDARLAWVERDRTLRDAISFFVPLSRNATWRP